MSWSIITGASSGIGLQIAEALAAKGYHVWLTGRNKEKLSKQAEHLANTYRIQTKVTIGDLSQPEGLEALCQELSAQTLDFEVLVNNAGVGLWGKFDALGMEEQLAMLHLNNTAVLRLTHVMLGHFRRKGKGFILNVGSTASFQAVPGMAVYSASKAFINQFSRALSLELSGSGISVTCVNPGATDTAFVERAGMSGSHLEKEAERFNMSPQQVAEEALAALFAGSLMCTPGLVNKLNYAASRILPRKVMEKGAAKLYLKGK